jgi:hypothetical protein
MASAVSAGGTASRRGRGPPARESAGPWGGCAARPAPGLRHSGRSRSPRTSPHPARSSARSDGRMPPRARWHAARETSHSSRRVRTARNAADGTTSPRSPGTPRSPVRSGGRSGRWQPTCRGPPAPGRRGRGDDGTRSGVTAAPRLPLIPAIVQSAAQGDRATIWVRPPLRNPPSPRPCVRRTRPAPLPSRRPGR